MFEKVLDGERFYGTSRPFWGLLATFFNMARYESFYQLDCTLTRYYLSRELNGDTVLRFIDASAENISAALEQEEALALGTLLTLCRPSAKEVYKNGFTLQKTTDKATGCLPYLVLACHAASRVAENDGSRDFRCCIQELLQDRTIQNFSRLNKIWESLSRWAEQNNKNFIPVELANPNNLRILIGRTQDMSFPAWRDETKLLQALSISKDMDEAKLEYNIAHYEPPSSYLTQGCVTLLQEYKDLMRELCNERRSTRFWIWLRSLGNQRQLAVEEEKDKPSSALILEETLDGWRLGTDTRMLPLQQALQQSANLVRYDFSKYLHFGLVVFEETGWGSYAATLHPAECRRGALLYNPNHHTIPEMQGDAHPTVQVGEWRLIPDVDHVDFEVIHNYLQNNDEFNLLRGCVPFILYGGVKHNSHILSTIQLAPQVLCLRDGVINFLYKNTIYKSVSCNKYNTINIPELLLQNTNITVSYVGALGKERIRVNRNLDVCEYAPRLKRALGYRDYEKEIFEAKQGRETAILPRSLLQNESNADSLTPLEEALYLAGGSGWHTTEILELCDALFPNAAEFRWLLLRSLIEGGWLTPVWGKRWGYKLHRLTPACLVGHPSGVLLWGARPQWLREEFICAASKMGASVQCSRISPVAPASLLAEGADIDNMAKRMKYFCSKDSIYKLHTIRPLPAPVPDWIYVSEQYKERKVWDWKTCRLESRNDAPSLRGVSLVQLHVPDDHRHHTLYHIRQNGQERLTTPVYTAAILHAYQLAQQPLFRLTQDGIIPLHTNAFLPLSLVRELAQWNALCPGPVQSGGAWQYVYPFTEEQKTFVVAQLGASLFVGHAIPPSMPVIYRHRPYGRFLYMR